MVEGCGEGRRHPAGELRDTIVPVPGEGVVCRRGSCDPEARERRQRNAIQVDSDVLELNLRVGELQVIGQWRILCKGRAARGVGDLLTVLVDRGSSAGIDVAVLLLLLLLGQPILRCGFRLYDVVADYIAEAIPDDPSS